MIWPFSYLLGKTRDRQQIHESIERLSERGVEERETAKQEHSIAAHDAILAVEHRINRSGPLRDVLVDVIKRQRAPSRKASHEQ